MSSHNEHPVKNNLISRIKNNTGVNIYKCYQCGKCSAGCPVAYDEMEYPPSMIMRLLQTEDKQNEVLVKKSYAIWVCLTCEMCFTRCPMEIDIPTVMDYVRQESLQEKIIHPKAKRIVASHKAFINSIRKTGRLHEMGFVMEYKLTTGNLTQDIFLAPKMFEKGKLHILAEKIKDTALMARIFKRTKK